MIARDTVTNLGDSVFDVQHLLARPRLSHDVFFWDHKSVALG